MSFSSDFLQVEVVVSQSQISFLFSSSPKSISKEIIKPSSPTPDHFSHYKLSFIDQISPPVYNPIILTRYYPLSGRLKENRFIHCNDEGIPYFRTQVKCKLSDVIQNPIPGELNKLFPFELDALTDITFGVQLNVFECGAIGIGACMSHKIADALSFIVFLKTWVATTFGDDDIESPEFEAVMLFPRKDLAGYVPGIGIIKENIITNSEGFENQKQPSRVEALSTSMWTRYFAATKDESRPQKLFSVQHAVNLHPRTDPPQPQSSFGNLYSVPITIPIVKNGEEGHGLMCQLQEGIMENKVDTVICLRMEKTSKAKTPPVDFKIITLKNSLLSQQVFTSKRISGKPIWVGPTALTFKNLVTFIDTPSGDGIEAYVSLKKEEMAKFESDEEFLTFVSLPGIEDISESRSHASSIRELRLLESSKHTKVAGSQSQIHNK
ncbi:hypothetical protein ACB098_03G128800 [Castanea mollissima]